MTITLELTESSGTAAGIASQHVFGEGGGTIGRANSNGWVFAHNKVSGKHALITFRNGVFYIEDTSLNGVCVNSSDNRLVRNRPYALKNGDRLFIEPYEITIWIEGDSAAPRPHRADPFGQDDPFLAPAVPRGPSLPAPGDSILPDPHISGEVDPLKFFDPVGGPPPRKRPELPVDDGLGQHYQPPAIVSQPSPPSPAPPASADAVIPAGYNPLADDPLVESIAPPPTPAPPARPRPGDSVILRRKPREGSGSHRKPSDPAVTPLRAVPAEPSNAVPPPPLHDNVAAPAMPAIAPPISRPPSPMPPAAEAAGRAPAADAAPERPPVTQPPVGPAAEIPFAAPPSLDVPIVTSMESAVSPHQSAKGQPDDESEASGSRPRSDLAALLAGAGVPDAVATPALMRNLGEILRVVVGGLMDVLQSRQRIKEEFRMQQTLFRPSDNNPLKFSVNVEDALHNLLVKRNPAYLRPVDAFADAFDDLRDHQLAMLAGMRVAFDAMLGEFDPERLQQQFDNQLGKGSLGLIPAKMRYWDLYRARRAETVKDPEEAFERLFGDEFRRAYEEQFRQLKAQRRGRAASDRAAADPHRP